MRRARLDHYRYRQDEASGLWLRDEEVLESYMDPTAGLLRGEPVSRPAVLDLFQIERHRMLEGLVNFTPLPRLSLRMGKGRRLLERIKVLRLCLERLSNDRSTIDAYRAPESNRWIDRAKLARLVALAYRVPIDPAGSAPELVEAGQTRTEAHTRPTPVAKLYRLVQDRIGRWAVDVMLHGSRSTLDTCAYSDLDTLVILRREVTTDMDRLFRAIRDLRAGLSCLYAADPLQHHGHYVIAEQDLERYPDTIFPRSLFPFATSLMNDGEKPSFAIKPRDCRLEDRHALWSMGYGFRLAYILGKTPRTRWEFKLYLSKIMLLPAMYLQALGRSCYKRESFANARADFDEQAWSAVEDASRWRSEWRNPAVWRLGMRLARTLAVHPVLASSALNLALRGLPGRFAGDEFYKRATLFAEQATQQGCAA